jgi:hypothetical protein
MTTEIKPLVPWAHQLEELYQTALSKYRDGLRLADDSFFSNDEVNWLAGIGLRPIHVFDYVEDFVRGGSPDWNTFLLVVAVRREHFLMQLGGIWPGKEIPAADLPAKEDAWDGMPWLPRITAKARCFLAGSLASDLMYGCGGDRKFFRTTGVTPPDFLRVVLKVGKDDAAVTRFVQSGGVQLPGQAHG